MTTSPKAKPNGLTELVADPASPFGTTEVPAGPAQPNAEEVAQRLKEPPTTAAERQKRYRERLKAEKQEAEAAKPLTVNAAEVAAGMAATWDLALVPLSGKRLKSLNAEQAKRLGEAFAPIAQKYIPIFASWQLEITAGLVLLNVVRECYVKPPKPESVEALPKTEQAAVDGKGTSVPVHASRLADYGDLPRTGNGPRGSDG